MTKQKAKVAMPRLRFPEFRRTAGWNQEPLSALLDYERPDKYIVADTDYNDSGVPVLTANKSFVLGYTNEAEGICTNTPVIIFDDFTTDKKYVDFPFKVKSSAIKILRTKNKDSLKMIFELMQRVRFEPKEHKRYYISEYQNLEIALPESPEQQKIADCLTSLDEVIAAQGRKVEALKAHKRGLMQQLFPREGETRPRLRFPEFRDAPEWEKKQLAELGEIITGKTPSTSNAGLWGGSILFITPTDIDDGGKYQDTSQRTVVASSALKVLPVGSIVYTCIASIGKLAITVRPSVTNQQINSLVTRPSIDNEFVYYALVHLTPWIKSIPATSTLPIINKTEFSAIVIGIPSDSLEQKAVADCLSFLDAQIAAESRQLAALKTHKQGLMQQLFPAPEGM